MLVFSHLAFVFVAVRRACVFFILSTPRRLLPLAAPCIHTSLPPQSSTIGWKAKARSQKCKLLSLMSHREAAFPTVCKYVVSLIERSSTSQQLSFLFARVSVSVLMCAWSHSWSHTCYTPLCTNGTHCPNRPAFVIATRMLPFTAPSHARTLQWVYHVSIITGCEIPV